MKERLISTSKSFPEYKVGVIGDFVADEYILGMTSRVSREAPVLILKYDSQVVVPGGGANAVNNVNSLGGQVFPIGVVGTDDQGSSLLKTMKDNGIDVSCIIKDPKKITPAKTRILAGGNNTTKQQVIRIDREEVTSLDTKIENDILGIINDKLPELDAIIVSDYSLGTVSDAIIDKINTITQQNDVIVTVDSRFNIKKFRNITAVTPNSEEIEWVLRPASGEDIAEGCRKLIADINSKGLLLTKGKEGMVLYESSGKTTDLKIYGTDEIADVTGAGDTVISAFTLALASGATMSEAMEIANHAGGIVVMKSGTATVTNDELTKSFCADE